MCLLLVHVVNSMSLEADAYRKDWSRAADVLYSNVIVGVTGES